MFAAGAPPEPAGFVWGVLAAAVDAAAVDAAAAGAAAAAAVAGAGARVGCTGAL
jgi:hypothetical protein